MLLLRRYLPRRIAHPAVRHASASLSSSASSLSSSSSSSQPQPHQSQPATSSSPSQHPDYQPLPRSGHFHLDPFTPADFIERRRRLHEEFSRHLATDAKEKFGSFDRHLLLIPSAQQQYMAHHVPYTLRQNSHLRYLTGHLGADAMLVLATDAGCQDFDTAALLVHRQTETERVWDGEDVSADEAARKAGLTSGMYSEDEETGKFLAEQMARSKGKLALWYNYKDPANPNLDRSLVLPAVKRRGPQAVANVEPLIDRLRWRKSAKEVAAMRRAGVIGAAAMNSAMRATGPGVNEAAIWAVLDFECRRLGAERLAYPPVIGGGQRSTIIHYMKNNMPVNPPDMILADSGAEVQGYVSDITRTWPASGQFTPHQRVIYDIVRGVLADCRAFCRAGVSLDDAHLLMGRRLHECLVEASVLSQSGAALSPQILCHVLCPHHVSHYLGMDVHDTPSVSRSMPLQPGVAFPLEPGLYLPPDCPHVRPEFRGVGGIRLEDDFVVTPDGDLMVLTGEAAIEPDEVEKLAGSGQQYSVRLPEE